MNELAREVPMSVAPAAAEPQREQLFSGAAVYFKVPKGKIHERSVEGGKTIRYILTRLPFKGGVLIMHIRGDDLEKLRETKVTGAVEIWQRTDGNGTSMYIDFYPGKLERTHHLQILNEGDVCTKAGAKLFALPPPHKATVALIPAGPTQCAPSGKKQERRSLSPPKTTPLPAAVGEARPWDQRYKVREAPPARAVSKDVQEVFQGSRHTHKRGR